MYTQWRRGGEGFPVIEEDEHLEDFRVAYIACPAGGHPQGPEDWEVEQEREAMHEVRGGYGAFEEPPEEGEVIGGWIHFRGTEGAASSVGDAAFAQWTGPGAAGSLQGRPRHFAKAGSTKRSKFSF